MCGFCMKENIVSMSHILCVLSLKSICKFEDMGKNPKTADLLSNKKTMTKKIAQRMKRTHLTQTEYHKYARQQYAGCRVYHTKKNKKKIDDSFAVS